MKPNTLYFELRATEFDWKISDTRTIKAWGFNEQVPGPALRANKGDTVVVKVTNELNEPTIVHWHGIRLMAAMDGTDATQTPIKPGEEFEYRFEVPDAGTFWYHSHHNETEQMEKGLYGSLVVTGDQELLTDHERIFMIDDMKLTKGNKFKKGNFISRWIERHDGREGDTLLLNGRQMPVIDMHAGQVERWRFINSSSARYFLLHLSNLPFKIVGTDGGLIEKPVEVTEALITPGERLEILVGPFAQGTTFSIESLPYNRMTFLRARRQKFAHVVVGERRSSIAQIPDMMQKIEKIAAGESDMTRKIKFSVGPSVAHGIDFLVNGEVHSNDKPVYVGDKQVWEISNTSLMDHPFHLHGFFFQVLEVNGQEPQYLSWKDTVNLPPRSKTKIAWIPDTRPGVWMYHCHILEHHEAGMMAHFEVIDRSSPQQKAKLIHKHHHH